MAMPAVSYGRVVGANERISIGIIGCGYVADHYLRTLRDHPILELSGVTDIDRSRAEAVATHYRTNVYYSNEDLWADLMPITNEAFVANGRVAP